MRAVLAEAVSGYAPAAEMDWDASPGGPDKLRVIPGGRIGGDVNDAREVETSPVANESLQSARSSEKRG